MTEHQHPPRLTPSQRRLMAIIRSFGAEAPTLRQILLRRKRLANRLPGRRRPPR
jgi:hypothetical protein